MRIASHVATLVVFCAAWLGPALVFAQGSLADLASKTRPTDLPGTEQEWIVRTVVGRLTTLANLANPAAATQPTVTVTTQAPSPAVFRVVVGDGAPLTLKVVGHIWDPRTYAPVAAALGVRPGDGSVPAATVTTADLAFVQGLTDTSLARLLEHDARISTALRAQPRAAGLHEQAALLLGALALREGAGLYTDGRPAWSRLTAHLAMARAVAPSRAPALAGQLAEALMLVEAGREVDALAALKPFEDAQQPGAVRAWAAALRVRASGDWRLIAKPAASTALVRTAYARAYAWRVGLTPLLAWLDDSQVQADLPLTRVMLSQSFPVAVANQYASTALIAELAEAEQAAQAYGVAVDAQAATLLNAVGRPGGTGPFRVLDWPLVAATAERHIVARMKSVFEAEQMLGRRERIRQLPSELEKMFATLPMAATALALMGGEAAPRHLAAAAAVVRARKDAIPPALWTALVQEGQRSARAVSWPTSDVWFNPWEPDGTALKPDERLARPGAPRPPLPMAEALHRLAPSESWLSWRLAWWRVEGSTPTIAAVRAEVGPAMAYDNGAVTRIFRNVKGSHEDYVKLAGEMCALNVERCEDLGLEFLKEGRDVEAATELRRWFGRARDRVAASNGVLWLTRYLFDTGQVADARAIAVAADDVGSGAGMVTLGELLERQGDDAGAEARYKRVQDRYGTTWHLGAHYLRRWKATGDPAIRDRGLALVAETFPAGFEVPPASGVPPADGVAFTNFGARAAKAGLRQTDVIVGIDGVRVRWDGQATVILRASHDAAVSFTVWRDGAYTTVKGTLPQRWLGAAYKTYKPDVPTLQ